MDYRMLLTYIMVDIFGIVIAAVIEKNITTDTGTELEIRSLKSSLIAYIIFMLSGLTGLIIENVNILYWKPLDYIANIVSLSCLNISGFYWFVYVQLQVNRKFMKSKKRILIFIPITFVVLLCISSPLTHAAFYIDENQTYHRGPLFMVISAIPLLYDICASVSAYYRAFKETQLSRKAKYKNLARFIYFPLIASILQILLAGMPILAPAIAASYFIIFTYSQKNMIYNDSLTGLDNRRHAFMQLEEFIPEISADNPLTILMIDGNHFKQINDTYGHLEGDAAILCIAQAVQRIAVKYKMFGARYGGDEFLMFRLGKNEFDEEEIRSDLNQTLQELCSRQNRPYILSVSAGIYVTQEGGRKAADYIKKADTALYEQKRVKK